MIKYFIAAILLLFLAGCNGNGLTEEDNDQFPESTAILKSPLAVSYKGAEHHNHYTTLMFLAEHTDESSISADDYIFQWPNYVQDNRELVYEVASARKTRSELNGKSLANHELGIEITVTPSTPTGSENRQMHIPLYMIPSLFEDGYPFNINEDETERIETGDLVLENITVEDNRISFRLQDNHPEQRDRSISYLFNRTVDNEKVYPLFSNVDSAGDGYTVELEFAQPVQLPARFTIERTTVHLPEWRFSFVVPLDEETE